MGFARGEDLERQRQQRVAGKHRRRLVKGLVNGRLAAPEIVIVHAGQVVMDQRITVDALERRRRAQQAFLGGPEHRACFKHEERAHPLAIGEGGMAHGAHQVGFRTAGRRNQLIERHRHPVCHFLQPLLEPGNFPHCLLELSVERCRFGDRAAGALHDLLDLQFRRPEAPFAMRLQGRAALIDGDRLFKFDVARFELAHDALELRESFLEGHLVDRFGPGLSHVWHPAPAAS